MSEQPEMAELLREANERLSEADARLTAAQLHEQERKEKLLELREEVRKVALGFVKLADLFEELVP